MTELGTILTWTMCTHAKGVLQILSLYYIGHKNIGN